MTKKMVQQEDIYTLKSVTNPVLSPDATKAVYVVTEIDKENNDYYARLYHLDLATEMSTQWTFGKERVSEPQWSPDGTQVAFLSTRDEKNQLYILQASGAKHVH